MNIIMMNKMNIIMVIEDFMIIGDNIIMFNINKKLKFISIFI